jgi:hypothetical protein
MYKYYKKNESFLYCVGSKEIISLTYMAAKYGLFMYTIHVVPVKHSNTEFISDCVEISEEEFKKTYKNVLKKMVDRI